MRIYNIIYVIMFCGTCLLSCNIRKDNDSGRIILCQPFEINSSVSPVPVSLDTLIAFADWTIIDSLLLIESDGTEDVFQIFNLKDFNYKLSFGKKGDGPNEFIMPHLIRNTPKINILDNALHTINQMSLQTGVFDEKIKLNNREIYWRPSYFDASNICFIENTPNELKWGIYNLYTKSLSDSLLFVDETKQGNAGQYDFAYFVDSTQLVLAFNYQNQISYYEISNKKLSPIFTIKGKTVEHKMYYTDAFIKNNNIYVLNQENVNLETYEGESFIDIYTNNGEMVRRFQLGFVVSSILYDKLYDRILLFSPEHEDSLYILPFSSDYGDD